jgi:hypothetical protein
MWIQPRYNYSYNDGTIVGLIHNNRALEQFQNAFKKLFLYDAVN